MQHTIDIEVRYYETDGQGIVHHANYFQYFELARIQMLKSIGHDYAELEEQGILLVVHSISAKFIAPAKFGDTLQIETTVERATPARIDHSYRVLRGGVVLAEGKSTIACINRAGEIQRMPSILYQAP
ncbi:acyl-CoA thioesterase [Bythopirellula goksoeyrii]|uniref:Acyl-CoA thioester hydrolase YbgC n=1 Tax=Bythopirellula goksoeyrii TaxID=1400387 RepID=A0A5B9Q7M0_9BACT|nr:thioesterase family protein [Bythopirellula goksoeyrii]QEG34997.1 Acyl-CoA thioester hydrolase YbgC [Bythopirellula goksoeyrii]